MSWKPRFDCMPRFLLNYDPIKKGLIIKPYERQKCRKIIFLLLGNPALTVCQDFF